MYFTLNMLQENKPIFQMFFCFIFQFVTELNHLTAMYCTLVVCLGGSQDSDDLREELKRMRTQAIELARTNRLKLIPPLRK